MIKLAFLLIIKGITFILKLTYWIISGERIILYPESDDKKIKRIVNEMKPKRTLVEKLSQRIP